MTKQQVIGWYNSEINEIHGHMDNLIGQPTRFDSDEAAIITSIICFQVIPIQNVFWVIAVVNTERTSNHAQMEKVETGRPDHHQ